MIAARGGTNGREERCLCGSGETERDRLEDLAVDARMILKLIPNK
jgi:hypothetical protein